MRAGARCPWRSSPWTNPPFDAAALAAFCRERLAAYKVPREFRRIEAADLPRSSTGKIQRHELEKRV